MRRRALANLRLADPDDGVGVDVGQDRVDLMTRFNARGVRLVKVNGQSVIVLA